MSVVTEALHRFNRSVSLTWLTDFGAKRPYAVYAEFVVANGAFTQRCLRVSWADVGIVGAANRAPFLAEVAMSSFFPSQIGLLVIPVSIRMANSVVVIELRSCVPHTVACLSPLVKMVSWRLFQVGRLHIFRPFDVWTIIGRDHPKWFV